MIAVHANRLKTYCDPVDRPIEPPSESANDSEPQDLRDIDLPADSFVSSDSEQQEDDIENDYQQKRSNASDEEPTITRPADIFTPQIILPK